MTVPDVTPEIEQVLTGLHTRIIREQRESRQYQDLAGKRTIDGAIDHANHLIRGVILDLTQALKDIHGIDVDHRQYDLLGLMPAVVSQLRSGFESENVTGCVDRARAVFASMLVDGVSTASVVIDRPSACNGGTRFCPVRSRTSSET